MADPVQVAWAVIVPALLTVKLKTSRSPKVEVTEKGNVPEETAPAFPASNKSTKIVNPKAILRVFPLLISFLLIFITPIALKYELVFMAIPKFI
ncbi:Uncharacterised protein [uncultured archaeon]|nr:Uncharacterised protein [uncultured archaeon]